MFRFLRFFSFFASMCTFMHLILKRSMADCEWAIFAAILNNFYSILFNSKKKKEFVNYHNQWIIIEIKLGI